MWPLNAFSKILITYTTRAIKRCRCSGSPEAQGHRDVASGLVEGFTVQVVSHGRVHCNARSHARDRLEDTTLRVRAR